MFFNMIHFNISIAFVNLNFPVLPFRHFTSIRFTAPYQSQDDAAVRLS